MTFIHIHHPGLLTTVQDLGRYGYQSFGMPVSGAMDHLSLTIANLLLGNPPDAAGLEATLTGPDIEFSSSGAIAVCGADMGAAINGAPISMNTAIRVKPGDRLNFTGLKTGCRVYIAFAGGIDVPKVMNSRSTYLRAKLGGFEGRALKPGDRLELGPVCGKVRKAPLPSGLIPEYNARQTIRILAGPEMERFSPDGIRTFLDSEYEISGQSDRMGYRLSGPVIPHPDKGADIISAGVSMGTIQMPGNGQPILLMADRQTTGGYARIANVATIDLTRVAQLKPGDRVRFQKITIESAHALVKNQKRRLFQILQGVAP